MSKNHENCKEEVRDVRKSGEMQTLNGTSLLSKNILLKLQPEMTKMTKTMKLQLRDARKSIEMQTLNGTSLLSKITLSKIAACKRC